MKNLYPKSKGKIHPSPTLPSAAGGGGGCGDALAVLRLLPAAIFALTAALTAEDKEVVAYLMIRSINGSGPGAEAGDERRRCRRSGGGGGAHRPLFDCGCFDCYTSFWSRWDCSKDREAIHMVIEAFEEHLARKERKGKEPKRKRKKNKEEKIKKSDVETMAVIPPPPPPPAEAEESKGFEEEAVIVCDGWIAEMKGEEMEIEEEEEKAVELPAASGEKRRGWADFVGMFNSRLWSLWSPGV